MAGYFLFFRYHMHEAGLRMSIQLNNEQYREEELMELKIALRLPYGNADTEYERIDGSITLDGVYYVYVKRKVSRDTLYLVCIPDRVKTKLKAAMDTYASDAYADAAKGKQSKAFIKRVNFSNEYNAQIAQYTIICPSACEPGSFYAPEPDLPCRFDADKYPPPRA